MDFLKDSLKTDYQTSNLKLGEINGYLSYSYLSELGWRSLDYKNRLDGPGAIA